MRFTITVTLLLSFFCYTAFSQNWQSVGKGTSWQIRDVFPDTIDNLLYVGGHFSYADTTAVFGIASWDGNKWDDLDSGFFCNCCGYVTSITRYKNEIYAGGAFGCLGAVPNTKYLARWNGNNWSDVGGGVNTVGGVKVLNDDLYVLGADSVGTLKVNSIAKWNGSQWSDVNNYPFPFDGIYDIEIYKGELYVAGNFEHPNGIEEIARWNGTAWVSVGGGIKGDASVNKMVVYNNELYVGGWFYRINGNAGNFIMKWNGSQWLDIDSNIIYIGQVFKLKVHQNKLYVIGSFAFSTDTTYDYYDIASFDGTSWCGLGVKKTPALPNVIDYVSDIDFFNNEIYVSCSDTLDGQDVNFIAKWTGGSFVDTCGAIVGQSEIPNPTSQISVSPNPSREGRFNIFLPYLQSQKTQITVYNTLGEQVFLGNFYKDIDLSSFPDGLYLIRILSAQTNASYKIIKQSR